MYISFHGVTEVRLTDVVNLDSTVGTSYTRDLVIRYRLPNNVITEQRIDLFAASRAGLEVSVSGVTVATVGGVREGEVADETRA